MREAPETAPADSGMILLNVLAIVAVASAVVMIMVSSQDVAIQRTQRMREAAQADAYARGGELSAVAALRRDKIEAPQTDNLREAWAMVVQNDVPVRGGRFSLAIADAQSRFNVNNVDKGGLLAQSSLDKILTRLAAPVGTADRIARYIAAVGPVSDLVELTNAGLDAETLSKLSEVATALPGLTGVNVNTAGETLLATMLDNPVAARVLVARRDHSGMVSPDDIMAAHVVLPTGLGFTSDLYWVRTTVTIGDTSQSLTSLLQRRSRGRVVEVVAVEHKKGGAAPDQAPPL
jgi:general secretion pathway protein K